MAPSSPERITRMANQEGISFITTLTELKPMPNGREDRHGRCVGYLLKKEQAVQAVEENAGDIHEDGTYPLCVVETLAEGIYPRTISAVWFAWDEAKGGYQQIPERPEDLKGVVNFSIG
jgi:hypothetical protein